MAFIGIKVPDGAAQELSKIDVPGEKLPPEEKHITLFYIGKQVPLKDAMRAGAVCALFARMSEPFQVGTARVTCFPENPDDGVPIICPIVSPDLMRFRARLASAFDRYGVGYSKKYPDYKPHVTLSYDRQPIPDMDIQPVVWKVDRFVLWAGDDMDEGLSMQFRLPEVRALLT